MPNANKFPDIKLEWKNGELPSGHWLSQISKWSWNIDSQDDSVLVNYNSWGIDLKAVNKSIFPIQITKWDNTKQVGECSVFEAGITYWDTSDSSDKKMSVAAPTIKKAICYLQDNINSDKIKYNFDPEHGNYYAMAERCSTLDEDNNIVTFYQAVCPPLPEQTDFTILTYWKYDPATLPLKKENIKYYYSVLEGGVATKDFAITPAALDWTEYTPGGDTGDKGLFIWCEITTTGNNLGNEDPSNMVGVIKTGEAFPAPYWDALESGADALTIVNMPIGFITKDNTVTQLQHGIFLFETGCLANVLCDDICQDTSKKDTEFLTWVGGETGEQCKVRKIVRSIQNGQVIRSYIDTPSPDVFYNADPSKTYGKIAVNSDGNLTQTVYKDKYQCGVWIKREGDEGEDIDIPIDLSTLTAMQNTYCAHVTSYDASTGVAKCDLYRNGNKNPATETDCMLYMQDKPNPDFDPTTDNFWCMVRETAVTTDDGNPILETAGFPATINNQKPSNKEFKINVYHDAAGIWHYAVDDGIVVGRDITKFVNGLEWQTLGADTCVWLKVELKTSNDYGNEDPIFVSAYLETGAAYPTDNWDGTSAGYMVAIVKIGKIFATGIVRQDHCGSVQIFGGTNRDTTDAGKCEDTAGSGCLFFCAKSDGYSDSVKLKKVISVVLNGKVAKHYIDVDASNKFVNYTPTGINQYEDVTIDTTGAKIKVSQNLNKNEFQNGVWVKTTTQSPNDQYIDFSTDTFFGDTEIQYQSGVLQYRKRSYTIGLTAGKIAPIAGNWGDWTDILTTTPFVCH